MGLESSAFLGVLALVFLLVLLAGKIITSMELRSQEEKHRKNLHHISELEEELETSRRRYLIALQAEGSAKTRVGQMKTRLASLQQQAGRIETSADHKKVQQLQAKERTLEAAVLEALGGPSQRDSYFRRVMKVISQLIDLAKLDSNEAIIKEVQEKLAQMHKDGELAQTADVAKNGFHPDGHAMGDSAKGPAVEPESELTAKSSDEAESGAGEEESIDSDREAREVATGQPKEDDEGHPAETGVDAPQGRPKEPQSPSRADRVRAAVRQSTAKGKVRSSQ